MQLQTRLWGGVDGEGACRVCVRGEFQEGYRGVTVGSVVAGEVGWGVMT